MQRLGVRLIELRNPEDAIVLGDALQQAGLDGIVTGRSRPVMFRTAWQNNTSNDAYLARITTQEEWDLLGRTQMHIPTPFYVRGYEVIYNVGLFAADPNEENWNKIWSAWMTPLRLTYRALVLARLLPVSIRWPEIDWRNVVTSDENIALAYRLFLRRVPPKRKKPIEAYMFGVERRDDDNPRTHEQHFDEPHQLALPFRRGTR